MIKLAEVFKGNFSSLMGVSMGFYDATYSTGGDSLTKKVTHHAGVVTYQDNYGEGGRTELEIANEVYSSGSFKAKTGRNRGQEVAFSTAINSVGAKDEYGRIGYFAETANRAEVIEVMNAFAQALVAKGCEWQQEE